MCCILVSLHAKLRERIHHVLHVGFGHGDFYFGWGVELEGELVLFFAQHFHPLKIHHVGAMAAYGFCTLEKLLHAFYGAAERVSEYLVVV